MNERAFDDLLRKSVETPRDLPFDPEAWGQLAGRLDAVKPPLPPPPTTQRRSLPWLFWLFLLPLLGWNIHLQYQLNSLKNTLPMPLGSPPLATTALQQSATLIQRDTVIEVHYRTVILRDTVWAGQSGNDTNTLSLLGFSRVHHLKNQDATPTLPSFQKLEGLKVPGTQDLIGFSNQLGLRDSILGTPIDLPNFKNLEGQNTTQGRGQKLEALACLPLPNTEVVFMEHPTTIKMGQDFVATAERNPQSIAYRSTQIGGAGAYQYRRPQTQQGTWTWVEYGVDGIFQWNHRLGIGIGAKKFESVFRTNENTSGALPPGQPRNPQDVLSHASLEYDGAALPLSLHVHFFPFRKTHPYIAIGTEALLLRKRSCIYDYTDALTDLDYTYEAKEELNKFSFNNTCAKLGFQGPLWQGFYWTLEANGRFISNQNKLFAVSGLQPGVSVGVGYRWEWHKVARE